MIVPIKRPDRMPDACESLRKSIDMHQSGLTPKSIQGYMLATRCKRVLRAIYGSAYAAIWAWLVSQVREDATLWWWRVRVKLGFVWMSKEDREIYDDVMREDV